MADSLYHWIKAIHILAVIAWMAGMLYLPRLFVYHAGVVPGSESSELFKIMERRLLRIIMTPAMIVTWAAGIWLMFYIHALSPENGLWMHYKLLLVLLMSGMHGMMAKYTRTFAQNANTRPAHFYRVFNEVPTILLIAIVLLVVVKPV